MNKPHKYVIAGKKETFTEYYENHWAEQDPDYPNFTKHPDVVYANTLKMFNTIDANDTIVLLQGWWGRSWAKEAIKDIKIKYPNIKFEYLDGKFGEEQRKDLISERVHDRFELLDL